MNIRFYLFRGRWFQIWSPFCPIGLSFLSGTYWCIKLSFSVHCCWPNVDILWSKLYIFNQYFTQPGNRDEQKYSEFVAKEICITNHSIYVITYCAITAKCKQPMAWSSICAASRPHRAISSLLASSFLSFPFRYQDRRYAFSVSSTVTCGNDSPGPHICV